MPDFLLELLSEEIPARMQARAREDLAKLFTAELAKAGLTPTALETYSTPRRLALIARDLPPETASVREELKGPRTGAPPQALEGFLRKTGLTQDQLTDRDGVYFAVIHKPGSATTDVLAQAIPAIIRAFPWPKSMRWGEASLSTESLRWVRPLQGIVALFGGDIVACEVDGIASGAETVGHRFHHPGRITIGSVEDYAAKLRACHVIVDHEERESIIALGATQIAAQAGLDLVRDEALLKENAGLTEWPVPLLGSFDPAFLQVPPEVIQLTMAVNQKYFACTDAAGALAPNFICTANIEARNGGLSIVAGNQKVLAARLSDAKFFWEQDLKIPLEDQAKKLSQIVFHEKLGTVADKVDRVAKLARWLVEEGIIKPSPERSSGEGDHAQHGGGAARSDDLTPPLRSGPSTGFAGPPPLASPGEELADLAETAARLCKADLVTGMVGEFPELQGIMGGYYAREEGLPDCVADAIRDHYKPVGQGDDVPTAPVTVAVSLADKLDTLVGFFAIGDKPSGSRDPYALRRAALGTVALLATQGWRLSLSTASNKAAEGYMTSLTAALWAALPVSLSKVMSLRATAGTPGEDPLFLTFRDSRHVDLSLGKERLRLEGRANNIFWTLDDFGMASGSAFKQRSTDLVNFFADRLKVQQREAGVRHDLIDAVFALGGEDDLVRLLARVKALQAFVETAEGRDLLAGYKRAANILKKENYQPSPLRGEGQPGTAGQGEGQSAAAPDSAPLLGRAAAVPLPDGERVEKTLSYTPPFEEQSLIAALDSAEPLAEAAVRNEDFEAAMQALATLRAPVDAFFEKVTVNDPDPIRREVRLALLARMRDAVHQVADFSRIEG